MGSRLFSHDEFKAWFKEYSQWLPRHYQTRKALEEARDSSQLSEMKRKRGASDGLESHQCVSRQRLESPGTPKNYCDSPYTDKQTTSHDTEHNQGQWANLRDRGYDTQDEVPLEPGQTLGIHAPTHIAAKRTKEPEIREAQRSEASYHRVPPLTGAHPLMDLVEIRAALYPQSDLEVSAPSIGKHRLGGWLSRVLNA